MATASLRSASPGESGSAPFVTTTDGVDLFCRVWGEGKPMVFLSGWTLNSDMWAYQMAPLSQAGLRCAAYDRRGHGRSSDPGRGYDYDRLADVDPIRAEIQHVLVDGDTAIAAGEFASRMRKTGKVFASIFFAHFTVRGGVIVGYRLLEDSHGLVVALTG